MNRRPARFICNDGDIFYGKIDIETGDFWIETNKYDKEDPKIKFELQKGLGAEVLVYFEALPESVVKQTAKEK